MKTTARRSGEQKGRILDFARDLFFRYGFTRVTIEEIVAGLHISKTTFYKFFTSKEDLLTNVLRTYYRALRDGISDIMAHAAGEYVEGWKKVVAFIGGGLERLDTRARQDIRTNAPEIWRTFLELQHTMVRSELEKAFQTGIDRGIVRKDMDITRMAGLFIATIENVLRDEALHDLSLSIQDSLQMLITLLLEGALTEKGRGRSGHARRGALPAMGSA